MALLPVIPNVGHPAAFDPKWPAKIAERLAAHPQLAEVVPASRIEVRIVPEMVSCGIREMDALTGGLPRGCLTEICGGASSGRTSLLLATLAAATQRQDACALVDVSDAFDPVSAASAGVNFERVLWVRCGKKKIHREGHDLSRAAQASFKRSALAAEGKRRNVSADCVEQALRVTDLLLQSGGFGLVIIDLGDVPIKIARRIPLTSWFRFQRAVERTPTVLFVVSQAPCTQSCAALLVKMKTKSLVVGRWSLAKKQSSLTVPCHAQLFEGLHIEGELLRSRMQRKPAQSVMVFETASRTG
jgi:recombination protein RecA